MGVIAKDYKRCLVENRAGAGEIFGMVWPSRDYIQYITADIHG
jgi:hypothetical protein